MHGKNPVRDFIAATTADALQVRSIFSTIQGEGPFVGRPAVFIRLTGCNLRCWFCDTQWDDDNDKWMSYDDIYAEVRRLDRLSPPALIVITGGEPLLQPVEPLVERLIGTGHLVQFETAGSVFREELTKWGRAVHFVISPKTPLINPRWMNSTHNRYWKYPLRSGHTAEDDGLPTAENTQRMELLRNDGSMFYAREGIRVARPPAWLSREHVFVTPVDEDGDWQKNVPAVVESAMKFGYTAQVQLHKIIGVE